MLSVSTWAPEPPWSISPFAPFVQSTWVFSIFFAHCLVRFLAERASAAPDLTPGAALATTWLHSFALQFDWAIVAVVAIVFGTTACVHFFLTRGLAATYVSRLHPTHQSTDQTEIHKRNLGFISLQARTATKLSFTSMAVSYSLAVSLRYEVCIRQRSLLLSSLCNLLNRAVSTFPPVSYTND